LLDRQYDGLEAALIASLASRTSEIVATVPYGDTQTIRYLERELECQIESIQDSSESNSLASLKSCLFEDTKPEGRPIDSSVELRSWPGEARECVEIVRTIQAEVAGGVPFDRIAVFLHSTNEYRRHLEEAFRRADIEAYFAQGTTSPDPAGRALICLLQCAAERLSARRFAEYVSFAQVPRQRDRNESLDLIESWVPPDHDLLPDIVELETTETAKQTATRCCGPGRSGQHRRHPARALALGQLSSMQR
jgi:hypothetical protein